MNARDCFKSIELTQPRYLTLDEIQPFLTEIGVRNIVDSDDLSNAVNIAITVEQDQMFGAVLSFSYGYLAREIWEDVTYRILPIDSNEARRLIDEPKGAKFLAGYRHFVRPDKELLVALLERTSNLVDQLPEVIQMDLELSFSSTQDIVVHSALIFCSKSNQEV